jgi:hypothetical protein
MRLIILYQSNTPFNRDIDYLRRQLDQTRLVYTLVEADSRDGISYTELYDAVARPAVIAIDQDGRLIQKWQGSLPSIGEIQGAIGTTS